jgi:hypothetical protein
LQFGPDSGEKIRFPNSEIQINLTEFRTYNSMLNVNIMLIEQTNKKNEH